MWTHGFLFYSSGFNSLPSLFICILILAPIWLVEASSRWLFVLFTTLQLYFQHFLTFWHEFIFRIYLIFSLLHLWNHSGSFQWRLVYRNQDLSIKGANCNRCHCFQGLSADRARKETHTYITLYIIDLHKLKTVS